MQLFASLINKIGMSWSIRRKLLYLSVVLLAILGVVFYILYPIFKENPTCTDGKQNGNEIGIDCGGVCSNLCESQVHPVSILWQRAFPSAQGLYDVLGYVENQNIDAGIPNLLYKFKIYDEKNVLIAERDGKTFLGPNQSSAIFEGQINVKERTPKRAFLEFEDGYQWVKTDSRFEKISLSVKNKNLINASTTPQLRTTISNDSLINLKNVEVAAVVRDEDENAIAVSKTIIENLPKQSSKEVFFTWLSPFASQFYRVEIIPRVNPFTVSY